MKRSNWLNELRSTLRSSSHGRASRSKRPPTATRRAKFELLEDRSLLAVLTVNSPLDNNTPGDGLVTLREAIFVANTDTMTDLGQTGNGADTIEFDSTVFATPKTISLALGQIAINGSLVINGPGRDLLTIDGQNSSRIFDIGGGNVTLANLTLQRGQSSSEGGAIRSAASQTTLHDCVIQDSASNTGGGGIAAGGSLNISESIIRRNNATNGSGGGILVQSNNLLTLTNSLVSGNSASGAGGGIYSRANLQITSSTITSNIAGTRGGGFALYFRPTDPYFDAPDAILANAVITGNNATASGGGFSASFVRATDSTISENTSQGSGGGFAAPAQRQDGISFRISGNVELVGCVISGNTASNTGGGFFAGNVSTLTNTIVNDNMGGGIFSVSGTTLNSSTVRNNSSVSPGGGIVTTGNYSTFVTRYYQLAPVVLNSSTITGNRSGGSGGGIYARGDVTATNSTISDNEAAGSGGGIFVKTTEQFNRHSMLLGIFGTATLKNSTASGNRGGGVNANTVKVDTSTVSGNTGGGIQGLTAVQIVASTITSNQGGGVWNGDDYLLRNQYPISTSTSIHSSIVAGNTGSGSPDLRAGTGTLSVTSSLIGDNSGTPLLESHAIVTPTGSLIGSAAGMGIIDPRLAPLADNGGPTKTHALLPDSPAIDAIAGFVPPGPIAAHDYRFNASLADLEGGPNLVTLGGTLTSTQYNFGPNQGLNLSSALSNPAQYSLELRFRWDSLSGGGQKIIDFKDLTSDSGLYTTNAGLQFIDGPFAAQVFLPNTIYRLVLTRDDTTDIVRAYLNGSEVWNFVDAAGDAVFNGPNRIIRFFQDDNVTGQTETRGGSVSLIRIYNGVLTAGQIGNLNNPSPPTYDQRGEPYQRLRDGNSDGARYLDIGAFELQESTPLIQVDYADAPDAAPSNGQGNYNTLAADNGPSHTIVAGLRIGATVDGDDGTLQNGAANADDVDGALPDDEDGVANPAADLVLTVGAQPTVNVLVTNTAGTAATLYGWIDYNANGVFDNSTERASVAAPSGTNNSVVTLTFPAVPAGFTGQTYARFRLSTDWAAANPTGPAADGEVEDYRATIVLPSSAVANSGKSKKIAHSPDVGLALANGDKFGSGVASLGDLDGDGIAEVAVGAPVVYGQPGSGAVHVLFMNANGTVKNSQRIASGSGGGPTLANGDYFGHSVAAIGDLNGDGVTDLAVGASKDDTGGYINGAVYVLFMNSNGTVQSSQKIATGIGGGPTLATSDRFGSAVASIGDLDGDGIGDLAVGASGDDTGGNYRGAVHILFMNPNGTVKTSQKIAHGVGGGPTLANLDFFGGAIANAGDLDGDGITELAVGASGDDTNGNGRGAVHVLYLNANGTLKSSQKIVAGAGGLTLADGDGFGRSTAAIGDLDGDGVTDLAVGAYGDDTSGNSRGAVQVLLLNANGTVKSSHKIASGTGGGPTLANDDRFGSSVAFLGDLDGDGRIELAIGAETDDTGGDSRGAVHVLFLTALNTSPVFTSPDSSNVPENTTSVLTVTAIDADLPPQTITYSIAGGADQSKFSLTSGGLLSFVAPPNYEAPTDANGDNVYVVIVQASDGLLSTLQAIFVTVTPVNDNLPVITSPSAKTVAEGTTVVLTLTATDADLPVQPISYAIVGGPDQARFQITSGNTLTFVAPPIFEMPADANADNVYEVTVRASDGHGGNTNQTIQVTVTSNSDFGDAPDATAGTGQGNYNTRFADNGPRHTIVPGLRLGASVDNDNGLLQNSTANADDVNSALPDDEDGVSNPAADLALTIGAQPTVNLRLTNTLGIPATLYGWIDYNADGVFENDTERASIAVPSGTNNSIVTLTFPVVPSGYTGKTYARFRLSTDTAAANPTGAAADGEVEDYVATIIEPSELTVDSSKTKILGYGSNGVPPYGGADLFGRVIASIGDLDGDGITDLAVGAPGDVTGGQESQGAVYVLFMNSNGTVRASQKIANSVGGGPPLSNRTFFGRSVAALGDLDGDGVTDLAVGAYQYNGQSFPGGVYVLFMNTDGTVKSRQLIASGIGGGPLLGPNDRFGRSVASLGDVDGDGVSDMAVGAVGDGGQYRGAVHILFMKNDGTVKNSQKIGNGIGGGPSIGTTDFFGTSVAGLGDIDGDGVPDLAVGAPADDSVVENSGAVHLFFLNQDGTAKSRQELGNGIGGGPILNSDRFGSSVASLGDIDGDGVTDLAVGATHDDTGGSESNRGAVHILLLNANGAVTSSQKIASDTGGGPSLTIQYFGDAVASLGDLDGDGLVDFAVGGRDSIYPIYLLFLRPLENNPVFTSPNTATVPENSTAVMTVTATDPDLPPQSISFSLAGGADQARFAITPGGMLSFVTAPNFEAPTDANADNVYVVTIQADDGNGGMASQTISVTVTPVNDNAPVFALPDTVSVPENSTFVLNAAASDADLPPQTLTHTIVGGSDQSKFSITPAGALSFKSPPDFETPTDANGDNIYIVIVQASDGSLTNLHAFLVTVTNVNEPPVTLPGDYNLSGTVDTADYVLWRNSLGGTVPPFTGADGDGSGTIDQGDLLVWRANFGNTLSATAAATAGAMASSSSLDSHEPAVTAAEATPARPILHSSVTSSAAALANSFAEYSKTRSPVFTAPLRSPHRHSFSARLNHAVLGHNELLLLAVDRASHSAGQVVAERRSATSDGEPHNTCRESYAAINGPLEAALSAWK